MQDVDPVERALESLRGRSWPGDYENRSLVDRLSSLPSGGPRLCGHSRRVMTVLFAVLLLGSVGFGAAGGVRVVKGWLLTIRVNGERVDPADFGGQVRVLREGDGITVNIAGAVEDADGGPVTIVADVAADPHSADR